MVARCRWPLRYLGYIDHGDSGSEGGYLFVKGSARKMRTHHLHMVAENDPHWRNYLLFRDTLKENATLRIRYCKLKKDLQESFPNDRRAYTRAKDDFIHGML